jgi:hypothetical protein
VVRGDRRSELKLLMPKKTRTLHATSSGQALKCRICPNSSRCLIRSRNGEVVILRIRNAVNTYRHAFASLANLQMSATAVRTESLVGLSLQSDGPFSFGRLTPD